MGLMKELWIQQQDEERRGFFYNNDIGGKYVCAKCFFNEGIKKYIEKNGIKENHSCNYCNSKLKTLELEECCKYIHDCICREWGHVTEFQETDRRDSEIGEYVLYKDGNGDFFGAVLDEVGFYGDKDFNLNTELESDILKHFDNDWFHRSSEEYKNFEASSEPLFNWKEFQKTVLKKRRFFFQNLDRDKGYPDSRMNPFSVLEALNPWIDEFNLIRTIEGETLFYRARVSNERLPDCLEAEYYKPPTHKDLIKGSSGRMSPDGIPIWYLALEKKTAKEEIYSNYKKCLSIGEFKLSKKFEVIDFTKLEDIEIPDFFLEDKENLIKRNKLLFLTCFYDDISKSKDNSNSKHLDYIPTQIVSEYLQNKREEKGVIYKSSKNTGGKNIVLFLDGRHDGAYYSDIGISFLKAEWEESS